jgi:pilus assembly protein Flp/PilA
MLQHLWTLLSRGTAADRREDGQGLVEYALILALIALICLVALSVLGGNVTSQLSSVAASV